MMTVSEWSEAVDYYNRDAAGFAARYDSVSFEVVHPLLARYLPVGGAALDIGAGSGRDARALAAHGLTVTAVEPSAAFRRVGAASDPAIRWIDDRLPNLAHLSGVGQFDLILCSAVLLHITTLELTPSFVTMAGLLTVDGRLSVNLRSPLPNEPSEFFFDHSDVELLAASKIAGLSCIECDQTNDAIGRAGYQWRSFLFERSEK